MPSRIRSDRIAMFSYAGSKCAGGSSDRAGGATLHVAESASCLYSKLKIRLQSSFMLTTVQPRCWASVSATSRRPIGETR